MTKIRVRTRECPITRSVDITPVHVGEILLDRYIIIQKLGWGHFSTVWLTKDLKYNSYVAIKVQKSAQHYLEAAYDEVEILDQVAKNWRCQRWNDSV